MKISKCIISLIFLILDIAAYMYLNSSSIHTRVINIEQIMDSVAKLKLGKSDCPQQILSYTNINGTHKLCVYISLLFSCMFVHGSPFQAFIIYNCTDSKG